MPDIALNATVSRTLLGLDPLDINDHDTYYLSPTFLGANVQWNRTQVTSPFMDGAVTTQRQRQMVTENITIEVLGGSAPGLKAAFDVLVSAFIQDSFTLTVGVGAATYRYACETSDYQLIWSGPRFVANQGQVVLQMPRQPVALAGVA